jgi:hypothetical protein
MLVPGLRPRGGRVVVIGLGAIVAVAIIVAIIVSRRGG